MAPSSSVTQKKAEKVAEGYAAAEEKIREYRQVRTHWRCRTNGFRLHSVLYTLLIVYICLQGRLPLVPGCDMEQSLEAVLSGILSRLREGVGNMCMAVCIRIEARLSTMKLYFLGLIALRDRIYRCTCLQELPNSNPARIMATCGSKGSVLNISQMVSNKR